MDIVYSIDDRFIPQAAALTVSVLEHIGKAGPSGDAGFLCMESGRAGGAEAPAAAASGAEKLTFHFLSNGIRQENQVRFRSFAQSLGGEAVFYDLGDFEGRLEKVLGAKPETGHFVKAALGRIFAPEYLPASVHRYLYLDADMIALGDLSELFRMDLQGRVLAAAAEPTIYAGLAVPQADPRQSGETGENASVRTAYFNTGLLLVDREAWDRERVTEKCLRWYAEHNGTFDFADQDILNRVLAGRILPLDQRWNFQTNYHYQSWKSLVKRAPWYAPLCTEEAYEAAGRDPVLLHFAGDERPWIAGNRNPYRDAYARSLARTPWKDTPEVKGRENYMRFYHAVNVLSARIPGFRAVVSEIYYRTCRKGK